jgi:hypothetical protein
MKERFNQFVVSPFRTISPSPDKSICLSSLTSSQFHRSSGSRRWREEQSVDSSLLWICPSVICLLYLTLTQLLYWPPCTVRVFVSAFNQLEDSARCEVHDVSPSTHHVQQFLHLPPVRIRSRFVAKQLRKDSSSHCGVRAPLHRFIPGQR